MILRHRADRLDDARRSIMQLLISSANTSFTLASQQKTASSVCLLFTTLETFTRSMFPILTECNIWRSTMPLFKKKAEMPTPEEIEAGKVKSYKDLIAPSVSPSDVRRGITFSAIRIAAFGRSVHTQKPLKKIHRKLLCCASSVNLTV